MSLDDTGPHGFETPTPRTPVFAGVRELPTHRGQAGSARSRA